VPSRQRALDGRCIRGWASSSPTASGLGTNLPQAGIDLGENGSIFPRPKGKTR
jgi:hypothetical protein